jgi:hypothetical protein
VIGAQSTVFVLAVTPGGVSAGTGAIGASNSFNVTTTQGAALTVAGQIDSEMAAISSTLSATGSSTSTATSGFQVVAPPALSSGPVSVAISAGSSSTLTVSAVGSGLSYQWLRNGQAIVGATGATYTIANASSSDAGSYTVAVLNASGIVTSPAAVVDVVGTSTRLVNLSFRGTTGSDANVLTVGFSVGGSGQKRLLMRGVGPTLADFGVHSVLAIPLLTIFNAQGQPTSANSSWGGSTTLSSAFAQVGAFALPAASNDCALIASVPTGISTAQVTGVGGTSGIALAEIYDTEPGSSARLTNLSARGSITSSTSSNLTAGFVVSGSGTQTVLIRGIGPALAGYGITNRVSAPILVVYDQHSIPIATNAGWGNLSTRGASTVPVTLAPATASVTASTGAFPLATGSLDCALILSLPAGRYSAVMSGLNGATGVGLVEIYEVP